MAEARVCYFCGAPARLLCDGRLAQLKDESLKDAAGRAIPKQVTCDRPLCRAHVRERFEMHINARPRHYWDSQDFCQDCVAEGRHQAGQELAMMTRADAEAMRARRNFRAQHPQEAP